MAITAIGGASAVSGATFTMPAETANGDVVVLNYGSAHNASGVSFLTPSGFTLIASTDGLRRCLFVFVGTYAGSTPTITCSAGSEYACTLGVFRGVNTTSPVANFSSFSLEGSLQIAVPSPGDALTNALAVGCVFVEDDNNFSNPADGSILVQASEIDGENSSNAIVYWQSPDSERGWRVGSVGFDKNTQVPANEVQQDFADPWVSMSLLLRPA